MISIIVYSRNDERGYGMHKRVALSLNAMAAVMHEGTSEIVFVDYNTPDHLPTLPELICDTLTPTARARTRVLRVRPAVHQRFAELSPLDVLEPIARNIGVRRARAQNPWILSTNTDSIFVPANGRSLPAIARDLHDGHYILPRFELPERVWETFDRLDADAAIRSAQAWGRDGRLNEIVRGEGAVGFDAPGDFQLVRRSDLFAIDGFNEDMLLGWHVDHNLAQRLELKLGLATSLHESISLYHCGHARQATRTHSHNRIENDVGRFVHGVRTADLPHQRDSWGCPDVAIEEIDLTQNAGGRLRSAIVSAMLPLQDRPITYRYDKASFDTFGYDAGHVATHVLDLLSTYPKHTAFGYFGCRRDLLVTLVKGFAALGFTYKILVPDDLNERLAASESSELQIVPRADVLEAADVLLFEFGLIRDENGIERDSRAALEISPDEVDTLETVAASFRTAVDVERAALEFGGAPRLFVAINALHNRYELLVSATLRAAPSPFTTRLRYGTVLPAGLSQDGHVVPLAEEIARTLGRRTPILMAELGAARTHVRTLLSSDHVDSDSTLEIAASADLISGLVASERFATRLGAAKTVLLKRLAAYQKPAPELEALVETGVPTERGISGVARLRDWDDPEWLAEARRVSASTGARGTVPRTGWIWERAQLLWSLSRLLSDRPSTRALVISEHQDPIVSSLADVFDRVDLADIRDLLLDEPAKLTHVAEFGAAAHLGVGKFRVVRLNRPVEDGYDAIILPHSAAFREAVCGLGPIISKARPLLKAGGLLAIAGEVALLGPGRVGRPDRAMAGENGIPAALAEFAGLKLVGDSHIAVHAREAALVGTVHDLDCGRPVLGLRRDDDIFWPAVWFFEAVGPRRDISTSALSTALADRLLGDQIEALSLSERARREMGRIVSLPGKGEGHLFFGPFLRLPSGHYKADVQLKHLTMEQHRPTAKLVAEVGLGADIVVQKDVILNGSRRLPATITIDLPFSVPRTGSTDASGPPCEIRLWSDGQAGVAVDTVTLCARRS